MITTCAYSMNLLGALSNAFTKEYGVYVFFCVLSNENCFVPAIPKAHLVRLTDNLLLAQDESLMMTHTTSKPHPSPRHTTSYRDTIVVGGTYVFM